ncbi:uncharacterized protein LOC130311454 [Hyla sarda]|uniref:uncharacterized protein LOC130311454 n=1 Tax=Hyla sarda TaxID=327740 RepID=UPI0024C31C92|nr:uncharacterized protein LOC130311454 [Hyla sarda]
MTASGQARSDYRSQMPRVYSAVSGITELSPTKPCRIPKIFLPECVKQEKEAPVVAKKGKMLNSNNKNISMNDEPVYIYKISKPTPAESNLLKKAFYSVQNRILILPTLSRCPKICEELYSVTSKSKSENNLLHQVRCLYPTSWSITDQNDTKHQPLKPPSKFYPVQSQGPNIKVFQQLVAEEFNKNISTTKNKFISLRMKDSGRSPVQYGYCASYGRQRGWPIWIISK